MYSTFVWRGAFFLVAGRWIGSRWPLNTKETLTCRIPFRMIGKAKRYVLPKIYPPCCVVLKQGDPRWMLSRDRECSSSSWGTHPQIPWVVLHATVSFRNTFNFVRWTDILYTLENFLYMPITRRILMDYLKNCSPLYFWIARKPEEEGDHIGGTTGTVGSLERSLQLSANTRHAIRIAYGGLRRWYCNTQSRFCVLLRQVSGWITAYGFRGALTKKQRGILAKQRIPILSSVVLDETIIGSQPTIKYFGLTLEPKVSLPEQINASAEVSSLNRLIAIVWGISLTWNDLWVQRSAFCFTACRWPEVVCKGQV